MVDKEDLVYVKSHNFRGQPTMVLMDRREAWKRGEYWAPKITRESHCTKNGLEDIGKC